MFIGFYVMSGLYDCIKKYANTSRYILEWKYEVSTYTMNKKDIKADLILSMNLESFSLIALESMIQTAIKILGMYI